jgi:hypothetical protein
MPYISDFSVTTKGTYFWRQTENSASKSVYFKNDLDYVIVYEYIKSFYRKNNLEKSWQMPIFYLNHQFGNIPKNIPVKTAFNKAKALLQDSVIHYDILSYPEKKFIKNMQKGFLYMYVMEYLRKTLKNKIKCIFKIFFQRYN